MGNIISIRHVFATALFVSAALGLTACGPEDDKSADSGSESSESAAAAPQQADKGGRPGGRRDDRGGAGSRANCPTLAQGHKVVWVSNVEGAMNNVIAKDSKCNPTASGATYRPEGALKTFSFSPDAKVTVITKDQGQQVRTDKEGPKTGIAHVKTCADPDSKQYDGGQAQKTKGDEFCWGANFYDVAVGSDNKITEMTEVYAQ
ncbi:hypothetical protein ABZ419_28985 [Streptomyces cinnamoneus]|uniref:hypothetical protein n=1 Tax=Streptomyces cinnamoneus TaxID=53446 RepID=UPI0033DC5F55